MEKVSHGIEEKGNGQKLWHIASQKVVNRHNQALRILLLKNILGLLKHNRKCSSLLKRVYPNVSFYRADGEGKN